jgi:hypothetical protein
MARFLQVFARETDRRSLHAICSENGGGGRDGIACEQGQIETSLF